MRLLRAVFKLWDNGSFQKPINPTRTKYSDRQYSSIRNKLSPPSGTNETGFAKRFYKCTLNGRRWYGGTFLIEKWSRNNVVSLILVHGDKEDLYQVSQTPKPLEEWKANADLLVKFTLYTTDMNRNCITLQNVTPPTQALELPTCSQWSTEFRNYMKPTNSSYSNDYKNSVLLTQYTSLHTVIKVMIII